MASSSFTTVDQATSRVRQVNVFYSIAIPIELFTTILRLWIKKTKRNGPGCWSCDDLLVVIATCLGLAEIITGLCTGPPHGLGRHVQAVSQDDLSSLQLGTYIFNHLYNTANGMAKLSILAAYYRIFVTSRFRIVVVCTAAVVASWIVVLELLMVFGCRPVQAWWGAVYSNTPSHCINTAALSFFTNSANLAASLWIFSMPIPMIVRLKTSIDRRACLIALFSIGLCTCAFSAVRLKVTADADSDDITWSGVDSGIVSVWEPCCGILCANLPLLCAPVVDALKRIKSRAKIRCNAQTIPEDHLATPKPASWCPLQKLAIKAPAPCFIREQSQNVEEVEPLKVAPRGHDQC